MHFFSEGGCKNFYFTMIIEFYAPFFRGGLQKFLMHNNNWVLWEERCIIFYVQCTIDFYAIRLSGRVQKFSIHNDN